MKTLHYRPWAAVAWHWYDDPLGFLSDVRQMRRARRYAAKQARRAARRAGRAL